MSVAASNWSEAFTTPGVWLATLLERAQVSGGQRERAAGRQAHECRGGERRALGRIGAAPDLVEQDERRVVRVVEDPAQHPHVRAEGREAGRDALPVADVGVEATEDREPAARPDRRHDPALRQRGGQTHRLEQHGLPAGVGAADEQRALAGGKAQIERDHRLRAGEQQRMAPVARRRDRPAPTPRSGTSPSTATA